MIDDLIDVAEPVAEAAGELALAIGGSAEKEEREKRKKKKHRLVAPIIGIILILGLLYLQFWRWGLFKEFSLVIDEVGYVGAIISLAGAVGILLIFGLFMLFKERQKKKNKPLKRIYFLLVFSLLSTAMVVYLNYEDFNFSEPLKTIPLIAFIFGITLMFIMLFDRMKKRKLHGIVHLGNAILMRIAIPMMPVWIIFLGAMSGKYNYPSVFLMEVNKSLGSTGGAIGGAIGGGFHNIIYKIVEKIFNVGVNRPDLWICLTIAILLILIYWAFREAFFSEKWPYGCEDDPEESEEAQYFIDETDDKFLSKEDLAAFSKGKLRLNKTYLDKLKKKEEDELNKMKGGN